jgi:DNA-binding CsgD family transcriptional regulator
MEARGTIDPLMRMSGRERKILALLAADKPYRVIAEHLQVSHKTVANTCAGLKSKLGARTRSELMRIAIELMHSATRVPR